MKPVKNERLVFVDRDGVLNLDYVGDYVKKWEDFKFLPGVLESLTRLKRAGFKTLIVSNQAGIGDGVYQKADLDKITALMTSEIERAGGEVAGIYYCLHGKESGCGCRKPKTGLFKQAGKHWSFDPRHTFFIGDKASDIKAGKDFGLRTIMVLTGYGKTHSQEMESDAAPDHICEDFQEAVDFLLQKNTP